MLIVIVALLGTYLAYLTYRDNSKEIADPVLLEAHIAVSLPGAAESRDFVLLGKMVSTSDCRDRSDDFATAIFAGCSFCSVGGKAICKSEVPVHFRDLFDAAPTAQSRLRLVRRNRFDRNAVLIMSSAAEAKANAACERIREAIADTYTGAAECVKAEP